MQSKKPVGRPKKENAKTAVLPPIRLTEEDKEKFKKFAKESGMSLSAWIMKHLNDACNK